MVAQAREAGPNCVVILGPTATGKTALGVRLARRFAGEIVSADSRQVYRGLDIGSGKDLGEYGEVPYHLIDIATLDGEYNVFSYQRDFYRVFASLAARGTLPVVVGGTGLYLDAVIRRYEFREVPENPELRAELGLCPMDELASRLLSLRGEVHNRTDLVDRERLVRAIEIAEFCRAQDGNPYCPAATEAGTAGTEGTEGTDSRPDIRPLVMGVRFPRRELRARIRERLDARLAEGLVDEVRRLHESGAPWDRLERLGLEYRFTAEYLQGKIPDLATYTETLFRAIGQFAKRQETWFRRMERKGVTIHWIERGDPGEAEALAGRFFG